MVNIKSLKDRKALLASAISKEIMNGAQLEHQTDTTAVLVTGHKANHILHFLISVFTAGLWIPVWFLIALHGGEKHISISVDDYGMVSRRKALR